MCSARPSFAPSVCAIVWCHERGIAQRGQADPEDAGLEGGHELGGDLEREPRLARTARTGEGDEARAVPKQSEQLVPLARPADEGGRGPRQVRVRDRLQRRKALAPELEERNRLIEVLHAVLAQLGQLAVDERPRRRRHDDLSAVAGRGDPSGLVQLAPGVALAGQLQLTGVQAHPHLDGAWRERLLTLSSSSQRLDRIGKGIQKRVPLRVDLDAAVSGEGGAQKPAVLRERLDVAGLAQLLDQPRRALDVREQQSDVSGRQLTIGHSQRLRRARADVKLVQAS